MSHRTTTWHGFRNCTIPLGLLAVGLLALAGCMGQQTRLQSEEDSEKADAKYDVKTVGEVSTVANTEPMVLGCVGLVVGLDGTGGDPPPGGYRTMLENELKKEIQNARDKLGSDAPVQNVKQILSSPNTSLVLVSATVPAGARQGDTIDVEITLPPGSKTTSLRGGYLRKCMLYNYDFTKNVLPNSTGPNRGMMGHPVAMAEGNLLVGFGDGDEESRVRQARIWGGAKCRIGRPFYLVMNSDKQYAALASAVADRINQVFHGTQLRNPGSEIAVAQGSPPHVVLSVPPQYHHNLPRFLRVARMVPLREPSGAAVAEQGTYRQRLEKDLLDPKHCVTAALRLEALGRDSVSPLKQGLQSEHPLVRFCAAESLAYMGNSAAGEVLASMVEHQPALRAFSLTALASLDEAVSHMKLRELLSARDAETRYGAFRALRALDERDETVKGELLNESFWLHKVAASSTPLVHMATSRRPEVVLFGEDAYLKPPFSILAGEFAITAGDNDEKCIISRFAVNHAPRRRQCSLKVEDVLRSLASMGGTYPEVVEMLSQAQSCEQLTCRVLADALPQATSVYELAREGGTGRGRDRPSANEDSLARDLLRRDEEIVRARADLGVTPNLFERAAAPRSLSLMEREQANAQRDRRPER